MEDKGKERFEHGLGEAVKASLRAGHCCENARARLLQALAQESQAPSHLQEVELARFEGALCEAVHRSQDWACEDSVAARVENALGQESGRDLLSERSVHAAPELDPARARYLKGLCGSVRRSQELVAAPPECRRRVENALTLARASEGAARKGQVIPLLSGTRWRRALTAATSVAAGFALVFGLFWGGAERALADTVRKDHTRCCTALKANMPTHCQSLKESGFGPVPEAPVAGSWTLVASKMCLGEDGQAMVHNVYLRGDKTMSVHLLPPEDAQDRDTTRPEPIGDDGFPVLAWEMKGWTVTACSQDLSSEDLARAVNG